MLKVGVIGFGYWGPNVVRNLNSMEGVAVAGIAEISAAARGRAQKSYPGIPIFDNPAALIDSPDVDAIAVITPVWTHYELALAALHAGKHVFVEKPFTSSSWQGEELINLAEQKHRIIMVDHTFLFTGAVRKMREMVDDGTLGKLYYYDSTRVNLGLFQHDCDVLWDLAPHDLSIMDFLLRMHPEGVVASGQSHLNGHADVAYLTLYFPEKVIAHINVNWLSPVKVRTTLIGGEKRMVVWNDLEADEKLRIYDRGIDITTNEGVYDTLVHYRTGDMWAPQLEQGEALRRELNYFMECANTGERPFNGGEAGLRVVRILEAASASLKQRGTLVYC